MADSHCLQNRMAIGVHADVDPYADRLLIAPLSMAENSTCERPASLDSNLHAPAVSQTPSRRSSICALLACLFASALVGCSNRAHRDLYQQRMANEIRVLEDQLYDADYQNRVLRDKLEHCQACVNAPPEPTVAGDSAAENQRSQSPSGRSRSRTDDEPEDDEPEDMGRGLESIDSDDMSDDLELPSFDEGDAMDDLELPTLDEGEPVDPEALTDPISPSPEPPAPQQPTPQQPAPLPPAPGGPEPPSKRDTTIPQIDPGEILPPPAADDGGTPKPNGQITLPDTLQASAGIPAQLRVHTGLSGGYRVEGNIDDMKIVVNVVDSLGKPVDLEKFDIDADLSIVILDPQREPSEARIGRWDFGARQVASFVRSDPIIGLHIPIQWKDLQPSGDEMIVHVRLRADEDEMRCEQKLKVEKKRAIAQWTPRGEELKR